MTWQDDLLGMIRTQLSTAEANFDRWKFQIRTRLGRVGEPVIVPYRGFGTSTSLAVEGRVLEAKKLAKATAEDNWWENVAAMYNRFESDEIPGITVKATLGQRSLVAETNEEGYFYFEFDLENPLPNQRWHEVHFEIENEDSQSKVWAMGEVLTPDPSAEFGIISDIDDTVLQSHVTDWLRMARVTLFHNALSRLPFHGIAEFYQALVAGSDGNKENPIFYVSSSSWSLYDLLTDFFDIQQIPRGPLLLRDLGLDKHRFMTGGHDHKSEKIDRILNTYPEMPFVLIGDSGQKDSVLYYEAVKRHPDRIKAIYIRDVRPDHRESIKQIIEDVKGHGIEMLLVSDTAAAAEHAKQRGLIASEPMQRVVEETESQTETGEDQIGSPAVDPEGQGG